MTTNIYSPPAANLDDETSQWGSRGGPAKFYIVGARKFWLLYIFTLGFYKIYWFYKNWSLYRDYTGESLWPVPRGIFSIFFVHSLFRAVDRTIESEQRAYSWDPSTIATLFVIFQIGNNVLDRLPEKLGNSVIWGELIIMLPVMGMLLYQAQRAINVACDDANGESNSELNGANYFWIVVGGIILLMAIIGLLVE